jgi:hypothetical protein
MIMLRRCLIQACVHKLTMQTAARISGTLVTDEIPPKVVIVLRTLPGLPASEFMAS